MNKEERIILEVIKSARIIQEFLWKDMNTEAGLEEYKRMFRKRISKIDEIDMSNPHWRIELKKRLLQTAAISINLINKINEGSLSHAGIHPKLKSNLNQYKETSK